MALTMNATLRHRAHRSRVFSLASNRGLQIGLIALLVLPLLTLYLGYRLGYSVGPERLSAQWQQQIAQQKAALRHAKQSAQDNLDALTLRLGQMQANVMRLDALGERLTQMAGLDKGEFDFSDPPGLGGPDQPAAQGSISVPDFIGTMTRLQQQLRSRQQQLEALQSMLQSRKLHAEVTPAGWPVKHGWMSSPYGWRIDPFDGKREFHPGIDFAGKKGSPVIAVAAGVVTRAGPDGGYGNLVQIKDGDGFSTRYGHNEKILVKVGQLVKKGQTIALMGSTGRSTGPHCHFEVWVHGKRVNPLPYVKASADFLVAAH